MEKEFVDEETDEDMEVSESEDEIIRPDWMILAEMRPNSIVDSSSRLGLRDIDRTHDWNGRIRQHYPDFDLIDPANFVQQTCSMDAINAENLDDNCILDYQTLNKEQMMIFKRIESHYNAIVTGCNQIEPLRLIIMGTAGTGKSYLINMIDKRLQELAKNNNIESSPLVKLAPTGVAAFNIRGATIHSTLSIPVSSSNFDIDGKRLKNLQEKLHDVIYIIIDEKSMVGRRMLSLIDIRLHAAFPEHKNQPFGGRSVILIGDFGQLPPVIDVPMYAQGLARDPLSNDGIVGYSQFREVYRLGIVQRQSGDSEE